MIEAEIAARWRRGRDEIEAEIEAHGSPAPLHGAHSSPRSPPLPTDRSLPRNSSVDSFDGEWLGGPLD